MKNKIKKVFLHTLLFIVVFILTTTSVMFIAGNTKIFEWDVFGRFIIVLLSISISGAIVDWNKKANK